MKAILLTMGLLVTTSSAFAGDLGARVLARYSNYFQGDDDAFATCLVLENSTGLVLIDGLVPNTVGTFSIPNNQMKSLKSQLAALNAKGTDTVPLLPQNNETGAVASRVLVPAAAYPGYSNVAKGSALETSLKAICKIDDSAQ